MVVAQRQTEEILQVTGWEEAWRPRFMEAREAGAQQSLSELFLFACHLPQGFPTHREKHKGRECSWTFRVLGRLMSRQGAQVAEEEQLPPSIWWLVGKVPSLPDNPLHPGSLIYSASETNKTKTTETNLNAYRKTYIRSSDIRSP